MLALRRPGVAWAPPAPGEGGALAAHGGQPEVIGGPGPGGDRAPGSIDGGRVGTGPAVYSAGEVNGE